MKLNNKILKEMVREALSEVADKEETKIKAASMSDSAFGKSGKESRLAVNPELTSIEKGIIQQIDDFLLKLAAAPRVDLNSKKAVIQRVMKVLQQQVGKSAKEQPQQQGAEQ